MDDYIEALFWHADKFAPQFAGRQADTVYFGGGTPSLLGGERLTRMLNGLRERFSILPDAEITVECNPDSMTDELLSMLKSAGVNRLSVGVQSAHDDELRMLGRRHSFAEAQSAIRRAQDAGFDNISLDLMYGLPGQSAGIFYAVGRGAARAVSGASVLLQPEAGTGDTNGTGKSDLARWGRAGRPVSCPVRPPAASRI